MAGRVRQRGRFLGVVSAATLAIVLTAVVPWQATDRATAAADATSRFVPVGPVRLTDTRRADCGCIRRTGSTIEIDIAAHPEIADSAVAVAVTVTATATATPGYVTAYPAGTPRPIVSTLNTRTDRTVANSAIIPVGADGRVALFRLVPGELIVDVTGVFVPAADGAGRSVRLGRRPTGWSTRVSPARRPARSAPTAISPCRFPTESPPTRPPSSSTSPRSANRAPAICRRGRPASGRPARRFSTAAASVRPSLRRRSSRSPPTGSRSGRSAAVT